VELIYLDHIERYLGEIVLRKFGIDQPVSDCHPNPSMHYGRVELLDIAYWTLSEIRFGTSMLEDTSSRCISWTMLSGMR